MKTYKGGDLKGLYEISRKIDGVNVAVQQGRAISRNGKSFDSIETWFAESKDSRYVEDGVYEFFCDSWNESVSLAKNKARSSEIKLDYFYSLGPLDSRLVIHTIYNPSEGFLKDLLNQQVIDGYEGIVLRDTQTNSVMKLKPTITYDLKVLKLIEGTKESNKNSLGAILTSMGKVSSGFTKGQRKEFWEDPTFLGSIVEVQASMLTSNGKLRHGRFIRRRFDKDTENTEE